MKDTQIKLDDMLIRVNNFGVRHATDFPAASRGGGLFATIAAAVPKVGTAAAQQVSGGGAARSGVDNEAVFYHFLHDDLMAIHLTAVTLTQTNPGVKDKFLLPHHLTYGNILSTAEAFAADAQPLEADFVACEMPADFLQRLDADITGFEGARDAKSGGAGGKRSATTGIDVNLKSAFQAVRGLDAIVQNKYRNNPATLAEWLSARHVARVPHRSKQQPAPSPQTGTGGK